jgi:hypothetical protein
MAKQYVDRRTYHDYDLLRPSIFDVLRQSLYRPRLQCLWRRIWVDYARLFVAHLGVSSFAFAFAFTLSATLFSLAPRLVLRQLLAMRLVFSAYLGDDVMKRLEDRDTRHKLTWPWYGKLGGYAR